MTGIRTEESKEIYNGEIISLFRDVVSFPDGKKRIREVIKHRGAAGIVPIYKGNIILVKQHRYPIGQALLEIPAGILSPGEDPQKCAIRELKEETGFKTERIIKLCKFYTTPGCSNEVFHLYLTMDMIEGQTDTEEDEDIEIKKFSFAEAVDMAMNSLIQDSKTLIGIMMAWKYINDNKHK